MHGPLHVYAYKLSNSPQNSCISCRNWTIQATGERQCPQFPVMSRESALTRSHRHRNSCPRRPTKIHRYLCHPMSPWAGFILTIPISSFLASHRGAEYRWLTRERRRHSGTCNSVGNFYGTDLQRT